MRRIPPPPPGSEQTALDSADLVRLAYLLNGRVHVKCAKCREYLKLTVEGRRLGLASSPDLSQIDPSQPSRPRLVFYCGRCDQLMGFVQGDHWAAATMDASAEGTRWSHLEMDENASTLPTPRVGDFDLED